MNTQFVFTETLKLFGSATNFSWIPWKEYTQSKAKWNTHSQQDLDLSVGNIINTVYKNWEKRDSDIYFFERRRT